MSFQDPKTARFGRQAVSRYWSARRDHVVSALLRGVILGFVLVQGAAHGDEYCSAGEVTDEQGRVGLLQGEGITFSSRSRVSVRKRAETLHIEVFSGEVLLRPRETSGYPIVVTAGSARIRNIEASVCVGVEGKRTVIAVLKGAVDMSVLTTGEPGGEITLRAGDRVELRQVHAGVMFHFASGDPASGLGCTDAVMRWARGT